jgi:hypothetical protein
VGDRFEAETEPTGAHRAFSTVAKSSSGESALVGRRGGRCSRWLGRRGSRGRPRAHGG